MKMVRDAYPLWLFKFKSNQKLTRFHISINHSGYRTNDLTAASCPLGIVFGSMLFLNNTDKGVRIGIAISAYGCRSICYI
jgi:hypothetical protein